MTVLNNDNTCRSRRRLGLLLILLAALLGTVVLVRLSIPRAGSDGRRGSAGSPATQAATTATTHTAAATRPDSGDVPAFKPFIAKLKAGTLSIEPENPNASYPDTFRWRFLPRGSDKWVALEGIDGSVFVDLQGISISPDEKYLAMFIGAGDPPTLEVVDLPAFLKDRKLKVIHSLDTYPGGAELEGWKDAKLLISSHMLLTECKGTDRAPYCLSFLQGQTFSLNPATGRIEAVSEDARNPARAMLGRVQAGDWEEEYAGGNSLDALVYLKAVAYRDDLRKLAAGEPNAERKAQILAAVRKLDDIARNPVATSQPAAQGDADKPSATDPSSDCGK